MKALGGNIIGVSGQGNSLQIQPIAVFGENKPIFTDKQWSTLAKDYNQMGGNGQEKRSILLCEPSYGNGNSNGG